MISFIRSLINSKFGAVIAIIFVGVVAIAFTLGDVTGSNSFGGLSSSNVAKVGNKNITSNELELLIKNRLRDERQRTPTLDMNNFVQAGGFDGTLDQIVNRYALAMFGEKYGMAISKRLVDYQIRQFPAARSADGKFSQTAFERFLEANKLDEKTLRTDLTQNLYAEQMLPVAENGPGSPERFALTYASLLLEKRTGDVSIIPTQLFLPKDPPSDVVLAKYYKENAAKFTIPERRSINYAFFDKNIIGDKAKPTSQDIADYYKANISKYEAGESRNLSQIIVPTQAAAQSVTQQISAGQSVTAVAAKLGLQVTETENVTRSMLGSAVSKSAVDAVFGTPTGGVAIPTKGSLGWYVIKIDAVNQTSAKSIISVTPEIEKILAVEKQKSVINTITSEIEDELANGKTIADMAKDQGLKIETSPKMFATGQNPDDPKYRPIPEMQVMLPAAFQLDRDGDAQLLEIIPGERYAIVAVAEMDEAAPPPLAKMRPAIEQQWAIAQGLAKAKLAALQVIKAVKTGTPLRDAMASLKIAIPPAQTISGTRADLRREGQKLPPPLALMFAMKNGTVKELSAPGDAGWFIVNLTQTVKGNAAGQTEMISLTKKELTTLILQEHGQQFVAAVAKDVGIKKYDNVLTQLRDKLTKRNDGN